MTDIGSHKSHNLVWFLWILCALTACALAVHAILNWDQALVIVEWETASELNTVGFNLLRSESRDGPFTQVNTELIPSTSDTLTGNQYTFEDRHTETGNTYYYILEELELTGASSQHGPIEVKAQNYAFVELIIASILFLGTVLFAVRTIQKSRQDLQIQ